MNRLTSVQHKDVNIINKLYFNSSYEGSASISGNSKGIFLNPGLQIGSSSSTPDDNSLSIVMANNTMEFVSNNQNQDQNQDQTFRNYKYDFENEQLIVKNFGLHVGKPSITLDQINNATINNTLSFTIEGGDNNNLSTIKRNSINSEDYFALSLVNTESSQSLYTYDSTDNLKLQLFEQNSIIKNNDYSNTGLYTRDINLATKLIGRGPGVSGDPVSDVSTSMINIKQLYFDPKCSSMYEHSYEPNVYFSVSSNIGNYKHMPNGSKPDIFLIKPNILCNDFDMGDSTGPFPVRNTWPLYNPSTIICSGISYNGFTFNAEIGDPVFLVNDISFLEGITMDNTSLNLEKNSLINFKDPYNMITASPDIIYNYTKESLIPDTTTIPDGITSNPDEIFFGIVYRNNLITSNDTARGDDSKNDYLILENSNNISLVSCPIFYRDIHNQVPVKPISVISHGVCIIKQEHFTINNYNIGDIIFKINNNNSGLTYQNSLGVTYNHFPIFTNIENYGTSGVSNNKIGQILSLGPASSKNLTSESSTDIGNNDFNYKKFDYYTCYLF